MSDQPHVSAALPPGKDPTTYRIGSCVGPRDGLEILGEEEYLQPQSGIETLIALTEAQSL